MDLRNLKNEKGITLIALAVTIVVLLILAGVTISSVFSENGIIKKAQQAENAIEKAKYNDLNEIAKLEEQINQYTNSNDIAGVDLNEYATLGLQAYVARRAKQKCDYLKMYVEISDVENESDKITYAIGTDWKENIVKENDDEAKLFLKNNSELEMIHVFENDVDYIVTTVDEYGVKQGQQISSVLLANGFTDVKISNLFVKKGKNYNIKINILSSRYQNGEVIPYMLNVYDGETGTVENNIWLDLDKNELKKKMQFMFDVNNSGDFSLDDSIGIKNSITRTNDAIPIYYIEDANGNYECVRVLIGSNGLCINEEAEKYLGFDLDRNGYIDKIDARYATRFLNTSGTVF